MSIEALPTGMYHIEKLTVDYAHLFFVKRLIESKKTNYQSIDIIEHDSFGKLMFLDGQLQVATGDEWIYHESLIHIPMLSHRNPEKVAIIGGGDGGALRETLKQSMNHSATAETHYIYLYSLLLLRSY